MTNDQREIIAWANNRGGYFTAHEARKNKIDFAVIEALVGSGNLVKSGNTYKVATPKKSAQSESNQTELFT